MRNRIVLLSKDVLRPDYLTPYGNTYWETENISELAAKGTFFKKHYTSAPSSAMSYTCMFSGLNAYQVERSKYTEVDPFCQTPTLFDILEERGYACHVIWDKRWFENAYRFSRSYGSQNTNFHNLQIEQTVGPHKINAESIQPGDDTRSIEKVLGALDDSLSCDKVFVWIHLPHVLFGRTGYGSDIDLLDHLVGEIRKRFDDDSIYITADHGHMNCEKGIPVYGAHVYEGAARIPLITPRIEDRTYVDFPTSNIQLKEIILDHKIAQPDYVFCDSQYYAQPNRRLAIIKNNYKYIYNKMDKSEELYDLDWDPLENVNLLEETIRDRDRNKDYFLQEVYFYPFLKTAQEAYSALSKKRREIWREGAFWEETLRIVKHKGRRLLGM